jgi:hypothetical protein
MTMLIDLFVIALFITSIVAAWISHAHGYASGYRDGRQHAKRKYGARIVVVKPPEAV